MSEISWYHFKSPFLPESVSTVATFCTPISDKTLSMFWPLSKPPKDCKLIRLLWYLCDFRRFMRFTGDTSTVAGGLESISLEDFDPMNREYELNWYSLKQKVGMYKVVCKMCLICDEIDVKAWPAGLVV